MSDKIRNEHIGGTLKMDGYYVGSNVLEMQLPGKQGRQKRRYLDVVKEAMQESWMKCFDQSI